MTGGHRHRAPQHEPPDHSTSGVPDAASWDEWYRSSDSMWSGRPNPQLVAEATDLAPGTALDVGCGEGADAIWLADRGWAVTAVDISAVALDRAAGHARRAGDAVAGRITWRVADLTRSEPGTASYHLVSAQFMQLPPTGRAALHRRLAAAVAPGGYLLVVGHHPDDMHATARRPPLPDLFFTAQDVAAALDPVGWQVLTADTRARSAIDPDGREVTIHDAVLMARRRR